MMKFLIGLFALGSVSAFAGELVNQSEIDNGRIRLATCKSGKMFSINIVKVIGDFNDYYVAEIKGSFQETIRLEYFYANGDRQNGSLFALGEDSGSHFNLSHRIRTESYSGSGDFSRLVIERQDKLSLNGASFEGLTARDGTISGHLRCSIIQAP